MLFSSITFLYYFLPCVLLLYYLVPNKGKNLVLSISSLIFYGWGEPKYIIFMLISILSGYLFGLLIEKYRDTKWSKLFLFASIFVCMGMLVYFKYCDFFISNINTILKTNIPLLRIIMPIGISFYTFQILSYTIDVYREEVKAQHNLLYLMTYITSFPQLIAGPIVRYIDVEKQLEKRIYSYDTFALGIRRFVLGLSKKILIANQLGELCEIFKTSTNVSVLFFWLYAIAFMLHIYFDFSGYSDMAIGLGKMLGFEFMENFNYPYISKSITEFWRRWHISLGTWFKDYVYIPLGGNRVQKGRHFFNLFVVWFLTGFWHGASWNFIIWGLFFFVLLMIEKQWLLPYLKNAKIWNHIYVLLFVCISFVIFNATDMKDAIYTMQGMFGLLNVPLINSESIYYAKSYAFVILLAILMATPLFKNLYYKFYDKDKFRKCLDVLEIIVLILLIIVCSAYLVDGSFNPFLYFRF